MQAETQDLTMLHDQELRAMGTTEAQAVLDSRAEGAALVRLTLARMYGSPKMATADGWHIVPHVTDSGTIGVVDVADGTAWDSGVVATAGVRALGLDDEHTPDANHPSLAGDVHVDGELVQRRGGSPSADITAPPGWRRIGLPTWRGYYGDGRALVPVELYEPRETWIHPSLRAFGLVTCYGKQGRPRRTMRCGAARPWSGPFHESIDPSWWPTTSGQLLRIQRIATEWLDDVIRRLVEMAGAAAVADALAAPAEDGLLAPVAAGSPRWGDSRIRVAINAASRVVDVDRPLRRHRDASDALDTVLTMHLRDSVVIAATARAGIRRIGRIVPENVIGARRVDLVDYLVWIILFDRLLPTAQALAPLFEPLAAPTDPSKPGGMWTYEGKFALERQLGPIATTIADRLLSTIAAEVEQVESHIIAEYLGGQPVYVDMPAGRADAG